MALDTAQSNQLSGMATDFKSKGLDPVAEILKLHPNLQGQIGDVVGIAQNAPSKRSDASVYAPTYAQDLNNHGTHGGPATMSQTINNGGAVGGVKSVPAATINTMTGATKQEGGKTGTSTLASRLAAGTATSDEKIAAQKDAESATAKLQAQRASSPTGVNIPESLKLTVSEAGSVGGASTAQVKTGPPAVTAPPRSTSGVNLVNTTPKATETTTPPPAPTAPPAREDSQWMKDLYGEWKAAYGKESGYRDKLMGDVANASYDPATAMKFAQGQSQEQAARDTDNASRQAIKAARTAGINPAQAALIAGQKTSDAYGQALNNAQAQALQQYNTSAQSRQQAASLTGAMQNQLLPSAVSLQQSEQQAGLQQQQIDNAKAQYAAAKTDADRDFWGRIISSFAPLGAGLLMSDERVKDNVKTVSYTYKGSSRPEVGVLAQDLEKTPLKTSVINGPDGVKRIDTSRLTTQNTAMIADLGRKIEKLTKSWGGK